MADNETIADIIAEKRQEANYIVQFALGKCHTRRDKAEDEARDIRREADRLEAAHRRERGDCAKLREAVGYILKYADSVACRDHDEHTRHYIDQIRKWAQSALAAPPRNCDRFTSAEEAFHAWNNTVDTPGGGAYVGLMDWLFAPATEGGNNGK